MLDGLLEVIGGIASLIGIWEFLSRRASARKLAARISHAFSKKTPTIHRTRVDPCVHRTFDPAPVAAANMNRYAFAGSYCMKTQILPGNHDIDVVAVRP